MTISFTIPFWLYGIAVPSWLAIGVFTFYAGGAIYAWYGQDQKAIYWRAIWYQWGRVERLPIAVLLWPLGWLEIKAMFKRRKRYLEDQPDRYAR